MGEGTERVIFPSGQLIDNNNNDAASSSDTHESAKYQSGTESHSSFDHSSHCLVGLALVISLSNVPCMC